MKKNLKESNTWIRIFINPSYTQPNRREGGAIGWLAVVGGVDAGGGEGVDGRHGGFKMREKEHRRESDAPLRLWNEDQRRDLK